MSSAEPSGVLMRVRTIKSGKTASSSALSFAKGEYIDVLEKKNDKWCVIAAAGSVLKQFLSIYAIKTGGWEDWLAQDKLASFLQRLWKRSTVNELLWRAVTTSLSENIIIQKNLGNWSLNCCVVKRICDYVGFVKNNDFWFTAVFSYVHL